MEGALNDYRTCGACGEKAMADIVECHDCGQAFHFDCAQEDETVLDREWYCEPCCKQDSPPAEVPCDVEVEKREVHPPSATSPTSRIVRPSSADKQRRSMEPERREVYPSSAEPARSTVSGQREVYRLRNDPSTSGLQRRSSVMSAPAPTRVNNVSNQPPSIRENSDTITEEMTQWFRRLMAAETPYRPQYNPQRQPWESRSLEEKLGEVVKNLTALLNSGERTENPPPHLSSTAYYPDETHELSRSQISARQVVKSELPSFSGDYEDWLTFISTYEDTTQMCGYTPRENIIRLKQALKGKALKAVQCRLRSAEDLPEVIQTLRETFGRPEMVIESLLDQIRNSRPPRDDRLETLVDFALSVEEICATVRNSDVQRRYDGPVLQELVSLLPPSMKLDWGKYCLTVTNKSLEEFGKYMRMIKKACLHVVGPSRNERNRNTRHVNVHAVTERGTSPMTPPISMEPMCACDDNCASLMECEVYQEMSVNQRWNFIRANRLCRCCLKPHRSACHEANVCGVDGCRFRHHPSLHYAATPGNSGKYQNNSHTNENLNVLLRYIPVKLYGRGKVVETLACLDEGSSVTLMEHGLIDELGLRGSPKPLCLSWTGGQQREENDSVTLAVDVSGIEQNSPHFAMHSVRTVRSLDLPGQSVAIEALSVKHRHLRGLPVRSYNDTPPRLLIGIDNYRLTCPLKTIEGESFEPVATKTRLGWVVSGHCARVEGNSWKVTLASHNAIRCNCADLEERLDAVMKCSFELDGSSGTPPLPKATERALAVLREQTKLIEGRFEVRLLWRHDNTFLPNNRSMALRRLNCLEKRLVREPQLRVAMNAVFREHIRKGYVKEIPDNDATASSPRTWYLPVFPVSRANKPDKIRVVWDAAAEFRGVSLNSMLLTGPDLLTPLIVVLRRFREYKIAVAADISEMYHQVCVSPIDHNSQRFLWRWDSDQIEPKEYVMMRMTFGAACSPSCAQFVKNLNAQRFEERFPRAARCIKEDHYVDDMLTSQEEVCDAIQLSKDVLYVHEQGGFPLHNWISNSEEVRQSVGRASSNQQKSLNLEPAVTTQKVLGMWWDADLDIFRFKIPARNEELLLGMTVPTKRQILSILMSIYDPLGLIAGHLFFLKVILQETWRMNTQWDEEVPQPINEMWKQWLVHLPDIENISIPRCYRRLAKLNDCNIQLHVFVDAGKDGYTAVAYFRFKTSEQIEVALVGGKTRVAPLKYVSVPRLELQAAVLGLRLANSICESHREKVQQQFFWTDSKDVICWLNADHRRYSTFVAHRVGEILESSAADNWHWIPTKTNVADEGTKWSKIGKHLTTGSWFTGPPFLQKEEQDWHLEEHGNMKTIEEMRQNVCSHTPREPLIEFNRFGHWRRLLRTTAYVWRFIKNARTPTNKQTQALTPDELQLAERTIISETQQCAFPEELRLLQKLKNNPKDSKYLPKSSPLYKRSPQLDSDGILRVRGRIDACRYVGHDTKQPIILPKSGHVTDLIVNYYHRKYKHANHQTVMNEVRQRFDIPSLRSACHRVRQNCCFCKVRESIPSVPPMGNLPAARLSPFTRPFTFTGIDFFGPFIVVNGRRTEKRWGVLFTCLTIRAVHIEVAFSLSTSSCIIAIRNFIARRGTPREMYSDQGTNFIGANRELTEARKRIDMQQLIEELDVPDTQWKFNPPAAPHFGGAWERLIGSIKKTLQNVQMRGNPTDEILNGWFIEVEGIINSRPLIEVPVNTDEDSPLTPNHFLLGSSAGAKPLSALDDSPKALKNTWHACQYYANEFWKRWIASYLPTLVKRGKWFNPSDPLQNGDIVLIVDELLPRGCWPMGRIVHTLPSKDGAVRRASVKVASGKILERPATKLIVIASPTNYTSNDQLSTRKS